MDPTTQHQSGSRSEGEMIATYKNQPLTKVALVKAMDTRASVLEKRLP